ncbi:hypothetical protein [Pseudobutyrivibrio ruminis]|uniref:Peptidase M23 domain-containing protein n=1 Tax=Pseudobutyrivibrio ruminis TaxID=46206 RepID=A0A2G3DY93_9FIRM|nr:hypothetical protein [Pseudobutyrivibrio ruminis]PHU35986.1 hypothetical protein CSX01_01775 [Pseudobutyrivibrio ruminis]
MKNRILIKTLAMATVVGTLLGTTGLTAFAAEATETKTETTKQALNPTVVAQVFDAEYYAKTNQDVVDVLGNDPAVLLAHYMNNGIYEGRDASATFNATIYATANTDLKEFYGDNFEGYIEHYVVCGKNEGRIASNDDLTKIGAKFTSAVSGGASSSSSDSAVSTGTDSVDTYSVIANSGTITNVYGNQVALGEFFDLSAAVGADAGTVTGVYVGSENNYHLEVGVQEGSDTSWSDTGSSFDESFLD